MMLPGWVACRADPNGLQHAAGSELLHSSLWVEAAKLKKNIMKGCLEVRGRERMRGKRSSPAAYETPAATKLQMTTH